MSSQPDLVLRPKLLDSDTAQQTRQAQSDPKTPEKSNQSERFREVIQRLNHDYNLSIELPDATSTPVSVRARASYDPAFARSDQIRRLVHFHSFQSPGLLERILHSFCWEARAASQKWIRLRDGLPEPGELPRAESPGQVLELQNLLIGILKKAQPPVKSTTFARAHTVPATCGSKSGGDSKSTTRSELDNKKDSPKQDEASLPGDEDAEQGFIHALRTVPSWLRSANPEVLGSRAGDMANAPAKFSSASQRTPRINAATFPFGDFYENTSFTTKASTSQASLKSIADEQMPSTQVTTPAPIEEEELHDEEIWRDLLFQEPTSPQLQDSFPESTGYLDALNLSLTEHEANRSTEVSQRVSDHRPPAPSLASTVYANVSVLEDSFPGETVTVTVKRSEPVDLLSRLDATWPRFPPWLRRAPFAVAWEVTRIAVHCGVDLEDVVMSCDETWYDYDKLRKRLRSHPIFAGKSFPERPSTDAWTAALAGFKSPRGQLVILSASLDQVASRLKSGPMFTLTMHPVTLDHGCRLHRRFGSDRFLEISIASPNSWHKPLNKPEISKQAVRWFSSKLHSLAGRQWRAFYVKDAGHKEPQRSVHLGPEPKLMVREKINLFAENGKNSALPFGQPGLPPSDSNADRIEQLKVADMLDWLLQANKNEAQPYLKLFARIQLGLSKTTPVVLLDFHQIRHRDHDMLSPAGNIMNDGIGRMSRGLARKVRDVVGLRDVPSAIQGRFGSAKGIWLIDIGDTEDQIWLETWPSQRKWNCDYLDPEHRTLEIQNHAAQPRSASLNVQFLPVLEEQAIDKTAMRESIGNSLIHELSRELEGQKTAMKYPLQYRQWVSENTSTRQVRLAHQCVPFLAGLPASPEETMNFLLDGGFDPQKQKYLQELAWNLRRTKCENLKKKMSIKVPNSAYLYMVVDFWNVLGENEVHVCFSTKFQTETFSDSMLHGCDVLVARSPVHFVSDIQRVKAVFKPELRALKDVVVFSAKGNVALAEKLSGGDYDGDKAWVCWEPKIVSNFTNAKVPEDPDLSNYLTKNKTTFGDFMRQHGKEAAISEMVMSSIAFNMRPTYLGIVTNYKERLCYRINSVNNKYAYYLSALLGKLVDQAKQGFDFTLEDWKRFRRDLLDIGELGELEEPAYKSANWSFDGNSNHIIDHLKFLVAKPIIDKELEKFYKMMNVNSARPGRELKSLCLDKDADDGTAAEFWDPDLVKPLVQYSELALIWPALEKVLINLTDDLKALEKQWSTSMAMIKDKDELPRRIFEVYEGYLAIQPRSDEKLEPILAANMEQAYLSEDYTAWALLRASMVFKHYYKYKSNFAWRMAGIQLQFIKAMTTAGRGSTLVPVMPNMYATLKPDTKFISQAVSELKDEGSAYLAFDSDGERSAGEE
ncbi:putative RNA-dependent RNA polymerase 2 [Colletotrichum chlorophyti]|uniref:RNA-dependent RNA polymerase n=1 Tax=Colletotrichum chlorophyti TaxID=708187 RepID=A0A1Q8S8P7_9PEZI|nr:putative RNA-dependent RNA polymerase 2 [Colletotrichum chlorophyti]